MTQHSDPVAEHLRDLRLAVVALRQLLDLPDQQSALDHIEDAVERLSRPRLARSAGLLEFDPGRLAHLLEITGPELAVELLARLTEDLVTIQDSLGPGVAAADWKRLREDSHVLISLSGSVGALSLQAMSENLNAIAHRQDREALEKLMPPLEAELASLIQLVRDTQPPASQP